MVTWLTISAAQEATVAVSGVASSMALGENCPFLSGCFHSHWQRLSWTSFHSTILRRLNSSWSSNYGISKPYQNQV